MDHREAGRYWNENAEAWTALSRAGHDTWRDFLNTPAFLDALPNVAGLHGLDIGCGEGTNTRSVVQRGARLTAIDVAATFVRHAHGHPEAGAHPIRYGQASAIELPFADNTFDFAVAFMCLMDVPENERALAEAYRVLKPGGFFQFSVLHPLIVTPDSTWIRDDAGRVIARRLGVYFDVDKAWIDEWTFSDAPEDVAREFPPFRTPYFNRTLSGWVNATLAAGFQLDYIGEPRPDDAAVRRQPSLQSAQVSPAFLHLRGAKPGPQR